MTLFTTITTQDWQTCVEQATKDWKYDACIFQTNKTSEILLLVGPKGEQNNCFQDQLGVYFFPFKVVCTTGPAIDGEITTSVYLSWSHYPLIGGLLKDTPPEILKVLHGPKTKREGKRGHLIAGMGLQGAGKTTVGQYCVSQGYATLSFSWGLKAIVSFLYKMPFYMLLGITKEARIEREKIDPRYGKSGRMLLEEIGTDLFRDKYDTETWVNVFRRCAEPLLDAGINVVIDDLRYANEYKILNEMGAIIICLCRDPLDLKMSDEEKAKRHESQWRFLDFYDPEIHPLVVNDGTKSQLYEKVNEIRERSIRSPKRKRE